MSYVIFERESTVRPRLDFTGFGLPYYKSERAAKAALTRAVRKGLIKIREEYDIAESVDFAENIEQTRIGFNVMTGKEMEIPVNTPPYLDPTCETYWSM